MTEHERLKILKITHEGYLTIDDVAFQLNSNLQETQTALERLENLGYLERFKSRFWTLSTRGEMKLIKTKGRLYREESAQTQLKGLIERAEEINHSKTFWQGVVLLKKVGYWESQGNRVLGILVLCLLESKFAKTSNPEFDEWISVFKNHYFFPSDAERLFSAISPTETYLKSRKQVLKLVFLDQGDRDVLENIEGTVIYRHPKH